MMNTTTVIKRNIFLYYLYTAFSSLDFTRGIFVIFFLSQGFSHAEVGIFQSVLFCSILLLEVPSGMFADRFKRKWSLTIGVLSLALAYWAVLHTKNFYLVAILFAMKGLGFAFSSGANSAILYDFLKSQGKKYEDRYLEISSKSRNLGNLAIGFAIWYGGVLQKGQGWNFAYGAAVTAFILAALCVLIFKEAPHKPTHDEDHQSIASSMKQFFATSLGKKLFRLMLGLCFLEGAVTPLFIFGQSFFKFNEVNIDTIGLIVAISTISNSFWYLFVKRFERIPLKTFVLTVCTFVAIATISFAFPYNNSFHIPIFILATSFPNLLFIFTDNFLHTKVPSKIRASMISVQSLLNSVTISLSYLGIGFFMDTQMGAAAISLLGLLPIVTIAFSGIFLRLFDHPDELEL